MNKSKKRANWRVGWDTPKRVFYFQLPGTSIKVTGPKPAVYQRVYELLQVWLPIVQEKFGEMKPEFVGEIQREITENGNLRRYRD